MTLQFARADATQAQAITALFHDSFAASEGPEEGAAIAALVTDLTQHTPASDIRMIVAQDAGALVGATIYSALTFAEDPDPVALMSPVAVRPAAQGQGVGQALISWGLGHLAAAGVTAVITYGDPSYYGRTGFAQISARDAAPPYPLSQPQGWLGQRLDGAPWRPLRGASCAVPAFARPELW